MPSINSNIAALIAHQGLLRANADLNVRLERLATGLRINRASDDPAGLVRADRLAMELRGLRASIDAAERGSSLIAAADAQLEAIAEHLETLKGLVAEVGDGEPPSPQERQLAIDAALAGIESIANTAVFGGHRLLDGSLAYTTNNFDRTRISHLDVHQADLAVGTLFVSLQVQTAAERARLLAPMGTGSFNPTSLIEDVSLEIRGPKGVRTLSFAAGTPAATMVTAINQIKDQTGVQASMLVISGASVLAFESTGYGSSQEIEVRAVDGSGPAWTTYQVIGGAAEVRDRGVDVGGVVNGMRWQGDGLSIYFTSPQITFSATLTEPYATANAVQGPVSVFVLGGGVAYQVGAGSTSNDRVSFGIPGVVPSRLGRVLSLDKNPLVLSMLKSGEALAVGSGDPNDAVRVVEGAIAEVAALRGRLGNIDRTRLGGAIESLQAAIEAATIGEARIRDADVAEEASALVRAQILSQSSISMIGAANANAEALLRLLAR